MLLYWAFRVAAFAARHVPLRVSYLLARTLGSAAFLLWPGGRRRCIDNMRHITGGDRALARRLARRSFQNYAAYVVDFFRLPGVTGGEIDERVRFAGWDELHTLRSGRGIVFVTMHFGNWDLGAAVLARRGFPIAVIADRFSNRRLGELVFGSRERLGMTIIPADRMGPGILRSLRRNDVVAVLQDIPQQGAGSVEVEFFGAPIRVTDGPARIALRAGSAVVAATLPREHPWGDRVSAHVSPVQFEASGDSDRDVRALTQAIFAHLEALVRRHPDQWYIFRHLWVADLAGRRG